MRIILHTDLNIDECKRLLKEAVKEERFFLYSSSAVSDSHLAEQEVFGRISSNKFYIHNQLVGKGIPVYFYGKFISEAPAGGTRIAGKLALPWYAKVSAVFFGALFIVFFIEYITDLIAGRHNETGIMVFPSLVAAILYAIFSKRLIRDNRHLIELVKSTLNATVVD